MAISIDVKIVPTILSPEEVNDVLVDTLYDDCNFGYSEAVYAATLITEKLKILQVPQ